MKTAIKTLFASALTAIVLTSSAFTTFAKDTTPVSASANVKFNKVVVTGNAKVVLVQAHSESITTIDELTANTTVQQKGYTLYINSTEQNPATIYISVKDLQRIDASNTAEVKTRGNFDLAVLQIFLKDGAKANVNAKVGSLYTDMKDQSDLKLSGSSAEHNLVRNDVSKLNVTDFVIAKL
ncbi:hypothetical protein SAMN05421820_105259 [Pedobacter steynii]|uniref:Putative auto-transporter adhesin head GIN domain-containing protein n=1 Tax=Pedobacter steynii TaxID=430522 RepID=A0A1G9WSY4_9SPHI|nr:DUF2807 domain-containing protein [Pedobacter steynii]NQX40379.1 DUF2807 domain-containing protein [Pedobacter steynii]SDM87246.1 hypothetical protein SAMN05421820_105259 [Pedobacter steynii]